MKCLKKTRRTCLILSGELDREESELEGETVLKLLKNEVDLYIDSDDVLTEISLKVALNKKKLTIWINTQKYQQQRFQIKNAIEWGLSRMINEL